MSAVEIEDVLSSIRRLVSEELRPMSRASKAEPEAEPKLMLTSALRVVPKAEPVPAASDTAGEVVGRVAEALKDSHSFEGETGDAEPQGVTAPMAWNVEPDDEEDVTRIEGFVFQSRQSASAEAARASEASLGPLPDESLSDPPVVYHGEVLEREPQAAPRTEAWAQEGPAEDTAAGFGEFGADSEDDSDEAWADEAEAEVMAALSAQRADLGADAEDEAKVRARAGAEMHFDEAVLRDLVRDLIREELQGSLGERITRNVRKLVRVEVARALSLHDLE